MIQSKLQPRVYVRFTTKQGGIFRMTKVNRLLVIIAMYYDVFCDEILVGMNQCSILKY